MKHNIIKYLTLLVLPLLLFSCSKGGDDVLRSKGEGILNIDLKSNSEAQVMTKADEPVFAIAVKDFKSGVIIKSIEDHRLLAESPIKLRAGKYIVVATNGTDVNAGFASPFYMGADTVEINAGQEANSIIECTLANVKVSIAVTDAVTSNFTKYDVTITNGQGGTLTFDKDHLTAEGYFKCTGTLTWTINLVNTDGKEFNITNVISDVKPRQHYKLLFDVNGNSGSDQGGTTVRVTYDATMTVKEYDISVNLNKKAYPTIADASGADITKLMRTPQGAGVIGCFNMNVAAGVDDIIVSYDPSAGSNANLTSVGILSSFSLVSTDNATYSGNGISWNAIEKGVTVSVALDMREFFSTNLALGDYLFNISIIDAQAQHLSVDLAVKVVPDIEISTVKVDAWGKFAYVYCQYNTETQPDGMGIQYKKSSDTQWIKYAGTLNMDGTKYSAKITGLDPKTSYDFMAVSTKDVKDDNIISATTEGADQLPNMGFDAWVKENDVWYPATSSSDLFWDSANKAAAIMGVSPTNQETSFVVKGSAAKLVSSSVIGVMAAGNLYTGYFVERVGTNAKVSFGRPYTCRPLKLHGYYNYKPVTVDKTKDPYTSMSGQLDQCQIYVMLTDWSAPYVVDSGQKNFINPDTDQGVIAYGQLTEGTNTGDAYKEFTIDLQYKNDRKPTHVVVVCCSSKYGDYFTGGIGSTLYVDEFSFIFE